MKIDVSTLKDCHATRSSNRRSRHDPVDRLTPRLWQYDYLLLSRLATDVRQLVRQAASRLTSARRVALDVGCDKSPYREILGELGWKTETLDIESRPGVDHVGTVEHTGLADASFDLVLCTQVIEHCDQPFLAMKELRRVLRPGGILVWAVPHIWFFHPHPKDHWRFTQEGVRSLSEDSGFRVHEILAQGGTGLAVFQILNFCAFGIAGRLGAPLYFLMNAAGAILDSVIANPMFCLNFAALCERTEAQVPADPTQRKSPDPAPSPTVTTTPDWSGAEYRAPA